MGWREKLSHSRNVTKKSNKIAAPTIDRVCISKKIIPIVHHHHHSPPPPPSNTQTAQRSANTFVERKDTPHTHHFDLVHRLLLLLLLRGFVDLPNRTLGAQSFGNQPLVPDGHFEFDILKMVLFEERRRRQRRRLRRPHRARARIWSSGNRRAMLLLLLGPHRGTVVTTMAAITMASRTTATATTTTR